MLAGGATRIAAPRPASDEVLQLVHEPAYVAAVRGQGAPLVQAHDPFGLGSEDNPIFDGMHEASALVTGATVDAAMAVRSGAAQHAVNLAGGLHHAMPARASGFCVYNDAAVAIAGCWPTACRRWPTSIWTRTTATVWRRPSTATLGC